MMCSRSQVDAAGVKETTGMEVMHMRALLLGLALVLAVCGAALADPWPNYASQTTTVDYVSVTATFDSGLWFYEITVDPSAPLSSVDGGIKALAVYPNGGENTTIPGSWTGYETTYTRTGWDYNGGYETGSNAFGYKTGGPSNYVKAGETDALIGAADYPDGYTPPNQTFLVHVDLGDGRNTFWARPSPPIPEAATVALMAAGLLPALAVLRRRMLPL